MGIGFVLLFWAIAGCVLAVAGAGAFAAVTAFFTRRCPKRRRVIIAAALFPFGCFAWGGAVFVIQAIVNEGLLHRDLGLGDSWHCPLPNGYQLLMIDVTDHGDVYNPKTQPVDGGVTGRDDAAMDVRVLQVSGPFLLGGTDSKAFQNTGTNIQGVDGYFLLDTRNGKRTNFSDSESLKTAARAVGVDLSLKPIDEIYSKYRFTRFDVFAGLLFVLLPLVGVIALVLWILRVRRSREPKLQFA